MTSAVLHTDGGSRGNPGDAGSGFSLELDNGTLYQGGWFLGTKTNNFAEYNALIWGLRNALAAGVDTIEVKMDSQLIVRQILGEYKVKAADLKPLFQTALALSVQFGSFSIEHVYREGNKEADRMANEAMDAHGPVGSFLVDLDGNPVEGSAVAEPVFAGTQQMDFGAMEEPAPVVASEPAAEPEAVEAPESTLRVITREDQDERSHIYLCEAAAFADESDGRRSSSDPDLLRNEFQRDRDKILHTKAFRRLSHKTQVFLAPEGDHYRTRLTHTLEVSQIARTIARALGLNEDLTEAIALGHDLGHTPFGHAGEVALCRALAKHKGIDPDSEQAASLYRHNEQSLRVVDVIENGGKGLNLTFEVRDGIVHHTGAIEPETLEGRIVAKADRIAYVNHDIDDAIRAGALREDELPVSTREILGTTHSMRIQRLVEDMVSASAKADDICMSPAVWDAMQELRAFLFKKVYRAPEVVAETDKGKMLIEHLFDYLVEHPDRIPAELRALSGGDDLRAATDFIAGMTDRYARKYFTSVFVPTPFEL